MARPELAALHVADPPERWRALGFTVDDGRLVLGDVELVLGEAVSARAGGAGIAAWTLRHVEPATTLIDGLATAVTSRAPPSAQAHPNGAVGVDHVVVITPDFDRTAAAMERAGMGLRRVRDAGGIRQGFRRLGPAVMEIVESPKAPAGPARFWGLVVIVEDLVALRERLQPHLGTIRPAVQPGRHIATLSSAAGVGPRMAFMDRE